VIAKFGQVFFPTADALSRGDIARREEIRNDKNLFQDAVLTGEVREIEILRRMVYVGRISICR
jgi:hypothetical protein